MKIARANDIKHIDLIERSLISLIHIIELYIFQTLSMKYAQNGHVCHVYLLDCLTVFLDTDVPSTTFAHLLTLFAIVSGYDPEMTCTFIRPTFCHQNCIIFGDSILINLTV